MRETTQYGLTAAVVTAQRTPPRKSIYYQVPDNTITKEELDKIHAIDFVDLIAGRFAGVEAWRDPITGQFGGITIRGVVSLGIGGSEPIDPFRNSVLLLVDDVPMNINNIDLIPIHNIAQIDILKSAANTTIFGIQGSGGAVVIYTKSGSDINFGEITSQPFHIKTMLPLGYQQPSEFYAPKYETEIERNNPRPDLRTTIHWQPVVQTDDSGMASFEFYTADEVTSYTVTIEGLANDGTIIWQEGKLSFQ